MLVALGPYAQFQPSCFHLLKIGFVMGWAVVMVVRVIFGIFSCLRIGIWGPALMGGIRKTIMQSSSTFGTFMAIRMDILC
ncbi:reactive oxygen species modulator 1-like [Hippopotamus amphibius kiboko]|uniref:reactive oxygen species modulator 1-like n=1 Tax=Hippopotamus amphibius kiboko TaxID=575201 RepID=UPI0025918B10|nr:reactive oxygen species modulator 1-like [Hippopotamus amphibius kiboko]